MNLLVVTADDFGLAPEVNEAVEIAHRDGILSAASLMVGAPAAGEAVARARRLPGLRVGLHLALLEARPAIAPDRIPDLVDATGRLRADMIRLSFALAVSASVRRQMTAEIAAQFDAFRATGLSLDHVNAHKHFHLHPVVAGIVFRVGRRFGMDAIRVPVEPRTVLRQVDPDPAARAVEANMAAVLRVRARRAGLVVPDAVFGLAWSGAMTSRRLAGLLDARPGGLVEIYTHPATADTFQGAAPRYLYRSELAALCEPETRRAVEAAGDRLGGFSDWCAVAHARSNRPGGNGPSPMELNS